VGAWTGSARFENNFKGYTGTGYITGLTTMGSSVGLNIAATRAGAQQLTYRVANSSGRPSSLAVRALDPATGKVNGTTTLHVPSAPAWTTWQRVPVSLMMGAGTNLVVCSVESSANGAINLDSISRAS
jgi:hypothetical protein